MKKIKIVLCFFICILGCIIAPLSAEGRDVILVLDTSGSMVVGNSSGFSDAKKAMKNFVEKLSLTDKVTLVNFDTQTTVFDSVELSNRQNIDLLFSQIDSFQASGSQTFTGRMTQRVKAVARLLKNQNPNNTIITLFFTDAIDDPPSFIDEDIEETIANQTDFSRKNYFFSYLFQYANGIETEQAEEIVNSNLEIEFFDLSDTANRERETIEYINKILRDTVPAVTYSFDEIFSQPLKASQNYVGKMTFTANTLAKGHQIRVSVVENEEEQFFGDAQVVVLNEGENDVFFNISIPKRTDGGNYSVGLDVQVVDFESQNPAEIEATTLVIEIQGLTIQEKILSLPEYYIPFIIICFILLVLLIKWITYLFFIPSIEMDYWLTAENYGRRKNSNGGSILKNTIEFGSKDVGSYLLSLNPDAFLVLPQLRPYDELLLTRKGKKYSSRLLIHNKYRRNVYNAKKLKGRRIINNTSFELGPYTFEFHTNIKR